MLSSTSLSFGLLAFLPSALAGEISVTSPANCVPSVKASSPKKLHCNLQSTIKHPQILSNQTSDVLADCAAACFQDSSCVSFGYASNTGSCQLLSASLNSQGWRRSSTSNWTYANRRCYYCPPGLYNGGFETGSVYPWNITQIQSNPSAGYSATFATITPGYAGSQYAAQINLTSSSAGEPFIDIKQGVAVKPSTSYIVSIAYQVVSIVQEGGGNFAFAEMFFNVNGQQENLNQQTVEFPIGSAVDTAGHTYGTWNYMDLPFNSGSNQDIDVEFLGFANGANLIILLDSITLKHSAALQANTYVENPDFESGSLRPWTQENTVVFWDTDVASTALIQPGQGGSAYAAEITTNSASGDLVSAWLVQEVSLPPNTQLLFSMNYNRISGAAGYNTMSISIRSVADGTTVYQQQIASQDDGTDSLGNPSGAWFQVSGPFTTTGNNEFQVNLMSQAGSNSGDGMHFQVDNIQIVADIQL